MFSKGELVTQTILFADYSGAAIMGGTLFYCLLLFLAIYLLWTHHS
jgi:hypothetical protein